MALCPGAVTVCSVHPGCCQAPTCPQEPVQTGWREQHRAELPALLSAAGFGQASHHTLSVNSAHLHLAMVQAALWPQPGRIPQSGLTRLPHTAHQGRPLGAPSLLAGFMSL